MAEIEIDPHVETWLTIRDFYTSFIISEMHRCGMVDDDAYCGYLKQRSDILLNEGDTDDGGSEQGQAGD